jgi:hypothetical protein
MALFTSGLAICKRSYKTNAYYVNLTRDGFYSHLFMPIICSGVTLYSLIRSCKLPFLVLQLCSHKLLILFLLVDQQPDIWAQRRKRDLHSTFLSIFSVSVRELP